ncbi:MAG: anti-sigma factor domain-containing protein, partial [Sphingobacterium sp.]
VEQAILDAQLLLEQFATHQAVVPKEELKSEIWAKLEIEADQHTASSQQNTVLLQDDIEQKVKPIASENGKKWNPLWIAASVLLVSSLAANMVLLNYRERDLAKIQETSISNVKSLEELKLANERWELIQRVSVKTITLQGVERFPNAKAVVFWDTQSSDVFLTAANLPEAPAGKQYQLWAIVQGQPVDAGVLPLSPKSTLVEMQGIASAEAFAITLEKEGGSAVPTLSEMYVLGNI